MISAKINVSQLTLYNPARMKDPEIVAAFVARKAVFERVLADIAAEKPDGRAQHQLIVGQRGMGKSTLLARLAAELRTDAELSKRFVPLVFAEEQYAVDRLSKFWLNCLDSFADAAERQRLASGQLRSEEDLDDWNRSLLSADGENTVRMMVHTIPSRIASELSGDARMRIRKSLGPQTDSSAFDWLDWGDTRMPFRPTRTHLRSIARTNRPFETSCSCDGISWATCTRRDSPLRSCETNRVTMTLTASISTRLFSLLTTRTGVFAPTPCRRPSM
jgi:hypothetical protein